MINIDEKTINKSKIFIVKKHHHVLIPWAEAKCKCEKENLVLVSFDHHTDTHIPFLAYTRNDQAQIEKLLKSIHYEEEDTVEAAINLLRNDEHIETALQCGILHKAFIIAHENGFDFPQSIEEEKRIEKLAKLDPEYLMSIIEGKPHITPSKDRHYKDSNIYIPPFYSEEHGDYEGEICDNVLEDSFLEEKFGVLSRMCPDIIRKDGTIKYEYVLDIDLDYFHTMQSINPKSHDIFSRLVKGAKAITIAKEPTCVEMLKTDKNVESKLLLEKYWL